MKNKYLRLLVALTKLMTAEKMRLNRFCQHGEYLAYSMRILPINEIVLSPGEGDIDFEFECGIETESYSFTKDDTPEEIFTEFEQHLSKYLNVLFERKQEFERNAEALNSVAKKLTDTLTDEEKQCLATHIDANTEHVLKILNITNGPSN